LIIYIMRGLPGSGKSTAARALVGPTGLVASTDDWFYGHDGVYRYDHTKLSKAHAWNFGRFKSAVRAQVPRIAVDNTNICETDYRHYKEFGEQHGYRVEIVTLRTNLTNEELAARNVHGCPAHVIARMRSGEPF
jgi:predicted kinase